MAARSTSFGSDEADREPESIHVAHARIERSGVRKVHAAEAAADRSAIQRLNAASATLDRSAVAFVTADHATIRQSAAGAVVTRSAACDEVRTGVLVAPIVRGDVHTWLDMRTAIGIGIGFFAGKLILDVIRAAVRQLR